MKQFRYGIIFLVVILIVAIGTMMIFFPEEDKEQSNKYSQITFVAPINSTVDIDAGEAEWIWKAEHGVLDNFINNYDGSLVSHEEWTNMSEQEREDLLRNGQ